MSSCVLKCIQDFFLSVVRWHTQNQLPWKELIVYLSLEEGRFHHMEPPGGNLRVWQEVEGSEGKP